MKPWYKDPFVLGAVIITTPLLGAVLFMVGYMALITCIQMIHAGWNGP